MGYFVECVCLTYNTSFGDVVLLAIYDEIVAARVLGFLIASVLVPVIVLCLEPYTTHKSNPLSPTSHRFGIMLLPLNQSIRQVDPNRWQIGSLVCERIETITPTDALATWEEHNCMYVIRETEVVGIAIPAFVESLDGLQLVHEGGELVGGLDDWKKGLLKGKGVESPHGIRG